MLHVDPQEVERLQALKREVVLGIITRDGAVRLRTSDQYEYPGHTEWLARDNLTDVIGGFSLLVSNGKIDAFFPRSRLNPAASARLEDRYVYEVLQLLPTVPTVRMLE